MAANKRTSEQREQDLVTVAALLRRGLSKREIGRRLQLDEKQIRLDWKECLRRLARDRDRDTATVREYYKEQYAAVKEEAWAAWDKSKEDKEKRTAETTNSAAGEDGTGGGERTKAVKTVEGRLPDADYLRVIVDCTNRQAELDDAKPPRRVAGPGGDQGDAIPITLVEPIKPQPQTGQGD